MRNDQDSFDGLDRKGRAIARLALKPRTTVYVAVAAAVFLSWLILFAISVRSAASAPPGAVGPGSGLLGALAVPQLPLPGAFDGFIELCLAPAVSISTSATLMPMTLMWFLMSVAMMLPSAAPMIRTYCEIADTARKKSEAVVHPLILIAGYLCAWLAASVVFAGLSLAIREATFSGGPLDPLTGAAGATALLVAGLYQTSSVKEACLRRCRNPFATLFARWSVNPPEIFRLGVEQGAWCVGCCWALMLVMFAVGLMNVFWMALIAVFAVVEKQLSSRLPARAAGTILLVWAALLLVVSR
jgi:predicted metal-binding membrane protein